MTLRIHAFETLVLPRSWMVPVWIATPEQPRTHMQPHRAYICIHVCVCVCVLLIHIDTHTRARTHTIYDMI
jgi:hypothetical protein